MTEYQHQCRSCGASFISKRKIHRTCSSSCKGRVGGQGQLKVGKVEKFISQMPTGEPESCWIWGFKKNDSGYGIFNFRTEAVRAHRMSYQIFVGEIPEGHVVRHKCDNPPCVNPSHLETGTKADNMRDMVERGRHWKHGRTECPNGHDLTVPGAVKATARENLCVKCARERSRKWEAKTRAALRTQFR